MILSECLKFKLDLILMIRSLRRGRADFEKRTGGFFECAERIFLNENRADFVSDFVEDFWRRFFIKGRGRKIQVNAAGDCQKLQDTKREKFSQNQFPIPILLCSCVENHNRT